MSTLVPGGGRFDLKSNPFVDKALKKLKTPFGKVVVAKKILKIAETPELEIERILTQKDFAHAGEISVFLSRFAEPFKRHKTRLKISGIDYLMKDQVFLAELVKSGDGLSDDLVTLALDQVTEKFDELFNIF
jgi:hypothetical protein